MTDWRELIPVGACCLVNYEGFTGYGQVLQHVDPNLAGKDFLARIRIHTRVDPAGIEEQFDVRRIVRLIDRGIFDEAARAGFPRRQDLDEPPLLMSPAIVDFYVDCVRKLSVPSSVLADLNKTLGQIEVSDADKGCPGIFVTSCVMCAPWVWRRLKDKGVSPADFVAVQLGEPDESWASMFSGISSAELERGVTLIVTHLVQALLYGRKTPSSLRTVSELVGELSGHLTRELSIVADRLNAFLSAAARSGITEALSTGPSGGPDQVN